MKTQAPRVLSMHEEREGTLGQRIARTAFATLAICFLFAFLASYGF